MTNIVQHKRGTSIPTAADLSVGEIGINMTSQKIYTKDTGGTIIELSPPNTPGGAQWDIQLNDGSGQFYGTSGNLGLLSYDPMLFRLTASGTIDTGTVNAPAGVNTEVLNVSAIAPSVASAYLPEPAQLFIPGGTAGQVLTSTGPATNALAWTNITATPAGANTEIQYNNAGVLGAKSTFTFDNTNDTVTMANLVVSTTANLGSNANVTITGGSNLQGLITNGSGVLSWGYSNAIQNGTSSVTIPALNGNILLTGTTGNTVLVAPTLTMNGAIIQRHLALGAGSAIDVSAADYFSKTITGATTFSIVNTAASNYVSSFILVLTNPGTNVTWWANVKWEGGTAPTLTTTGTDILGFFTYDNGATWRGLVLAKDSK